MFESLRSEVIYRWRALALIAAAIVVAAITVIASTPIATAAGIFFMVFLTLLLNPAAHAPPRPKLELIALAQPDPYPSKAVARIFAEASLKDDETLKPTPSEPKSLTVGQRRPLDIDSVLKDAIRQARMNAPRKDGLASFALMTPRLAPPTDEDYKSFAAEVEKYGDRVRAWLTKIDEYLSERSTIFIAEACLTNSAKLDAENARVVIRFPAGITWAEEFPELPEGPEAPTFPRRLSGFGRMMDYTQPHYGGYAGAIAPISAGIVNRPAQLRVWDPRYAIVNGCLQIDYARQTIHHGETARAGEPFFIRSHETGTYEINWEIHASNLPSAREGTVTFTHAGEQEIGEPIQTLGDLESVLDDFALDAD